MSLKPTTRNQQYPVFAMCGSDLKRRKLLQVLDPELKYLPDQSQKAAMIIVSTADTPVKD